ncbi:MAG TPA: GGDEF domain-containing protein [Thermoleophilaceae bacterium]|nr:GGDEF domain-containing protein [Thermoleophilaceae bacterium]
MSEIRHDAEAWFALSSELFCTLDGDGRLLAVNEAWTDSLGRPAESLLGTRLDRLVHPDDSGRVAAAIVSLGEPSALGDLETRCPTNDGSWRCITWRARSDGERIYAVGRDDTELHAVARQRDELSERVQRIVQHDELTGLHNRSAWHMRLKHELMRAERSQRPLGLVLIDIDGFKAINDAQGHQEGDRLLRECAREWRRAIRMTDCLGRLGGDDFALVLPDCDSEGASDVLERLREATPDGVTTSMGVAEWRPPEPPERLMLRADRALYEAKSHGRDRVASAR